jgi:tetratricopeptide (TPR) repeat protein
MPPTDQNPYDQQVWEQAKAAFLAKDAAEAERLASTLPKSAEVLAFLGRIQAITGRLKMATESFNMALSLKPESKTILGALFSLHSKLNELEPAITVAKKLTQLQPQDSDAWANLCDVLVQAGRFQEAVDTFTGALTSGADVADIRFFLGVSYLKMRRLEEARDQLRIAVELAPTRPRFWEVFGHIYVEMYNTSAAYCFERAAEVAPPGLYKDGLRQKSTKFGFDSPEQAESWLKQVIERNPNDPGGYGLLSVIQQQAGKFGDAAKSLEKVIELDPDTANSYLGLVNCRKMTEADQPLIAQIEVLLQKPSRSLQDQLALLFARGKVYNDLGQYQEGLETFRKANRLAAEFYQANFDREKHSARVDHLIQTFTRERFENAKGSDSELPVLIVGMMRSGTTLSDRVLSAHPQVVTAGELRFWLERVGETPTAEPDTQRIAQFGEEYLQLLSRFGPDATRITNKNPANLWFLGTFLLAFPKGRIIHMRRHPVDNCLSIFMTPLGDPAPFVFDLDDLVFAYREYERLMAHWREVLPPERFMEVNYEELVSNTEAQARRMVEFCGLPWDDACLHPEENDQEIRTASLWQARQPVYSSSLERWRRYEPWLGSLRKLLLASGDE